MQNLRFTLPFSRIIDMEGLDESFTVSVRVTPAGCGLAAGNGEEKTAEWELDLNVFCTAEKLGTGVGVAGVIVSPKYCLNVISIGISKSALLNPYNESISLLFSLLIHST